MCEVGSCCGCISLYRGCIIIGGVTIIIGLTQAVLFSLILYTSYSSSMQASSQTVSNSTAVGDDSTNFFYSFTSNLCPFGFVPFTVRNESTFNISSTVVIEATEDNFNTTDSSATGMGGSLIQPNVTYVANPINSSKISCVAPQQGVLLAVVLVSGFYAPVGAMLIVGVRRTASCLLSTWFFYTVGYNLLCLIVAVTDGVYTGAGDISSYIIVFITAYSINVVDSYYEKVLVTQEQVKATSSRLNAGHPSLVVLKSTPVSPSSPPGPLSFGDPHRRGLTAPHGYSLAPSDACDLLIPSRAESREMSPA